MDDIASIRAVLEPHMRRRRFKSGPVIHSPEKRSDSFYWIYSGDIGFGNVTEHGDMLDMFVLGRDESFGDISLFSGTPPPHTATVRRDCELGAIEGNRFRELIDAHTGLRAWVLHRLAQKLSSTYLLLDEVRSQRPQERVWRYLAWLASNGFGSGDDGRVIAITQVALASRLGLSRATVCEALRALKSSGSIVTGYGKIRLTR